MDDKPTWYVKVDSESIANLRLLLDDLRSLVERLEQAKIITEQHDLIVRMRKHCTCQCFEKATRDIVLEKIGWKLSKERDNER